MKKAFALGVALCLAVACAHLTEADKNRELAKSSGKYKVKLTEDAETVQGQCKFLRYIEPSYDPIMAPTKAEFDDYLRVEAVLLGADTVLVRQRVGEAYLCGSTPLNPDGTRKSEYGSVTPPQATPHP
ncbi:MAG TPA: hypothetical protein VGH97_17630 [Thermoanaerobaculia bacterium]|jgi:hypothetical protein